MGYNIDTTRTLHSTLRISKKNLRRALKMDGLPEVHPFDGLKVGEDGYAKIEEFAWGGEGSGWSFPEVFRAAAALTEGNADLIMTWEGGDSHGGVRIRDGKVKECEVIMTLAPEQP